MDDINSQSFGNLQPSPCLLKDHHNHYKAIRAHWYVYVSHASESSPVKADLFIFGSGTMVFC